VTGEERRDADEGEVATLRSRVADLERTQRGLEMLAQLAAELGEGLEIEELGRRIAEGARRLVGGDCSRLRLVGPDGVARSVAWVGDAAGIQLPDAQADPGVDLDATRTVLLESGAPRLLGVPLRARGRLIGSVTVGYSVDRSSSQDEVTLLRAFSRLAALAIEVSTLEQVRTDQRREAEVLADLTRTIAEGFDSETVLQRAAAATRELCRSDQAAIALRDAESGGMTFRHWAIVDEPGAGPAQVEAGRDAGRQVLASGKPFRTPDCATDPRLTADDVASARERGAVALMVVPIRAERLEGLLYVERRSAWPFSERDEANAVTLAHTLAVAIRDAQMIARERSGAGKAAQALAASEERLRHAQQMETVGRLAGGIAHDFNNALTVISGRSALLQAGLEEADPRRLHADVIGQVAARAARLTEHVLGLGLGRAPEPVVLDLNRVVGELGVILPHLIGEHIDLMVDAAADLGRVRADRSQIEQILLDLAVDARDAMTSGGRLLIQTRNATLDPAFASGPPGLSPGAYVTLAVSDSGPGVSREAQSRALEPLVASWRRQGGTRPGLSTVRGVVKQCGGEVTIDSEGGRGTTVQIFLPRVEDLPEAAAPAPPAERLAGRRATETVLVVEDDRGVREFVRDYLRGAGYTVLEAASPGEALLVAERHAGGIDLLLSDVVMPGMNGRELAERLARSRPGISVLFMSGYADAAVVHLGVLPPAAILIAKPFTPRALAARVRAILDARFGPEPLGDNVV
jgi:signal transduction histidine kinase